MFEDTYLKIKSYIKKAIEYPYGKSSLDKQLETLRVSGFDLMMTGSYALKHHYNMLYREPKDIDVIIIVKEPYVLQHFIHLYEEIIGTHNIGYSNYSSNFSVKINSMTVDFFVKEDNQKEVCIVENNVKIMSIKHIFDAKWQMNPYKAFTDYLEMEQRKHEPEKEKLPF